MRQLLGLTAAARGMGFTSKTLSRLLTWAGGQVDLLGGSTALSNTATKTAINSARFAGYELGNGSLLAFIASYTIGSVNATPTHTVTFEMGGRVLATSGDIAVEAGPYLIAGIGEIYNAGATAKIEMTCIQASSAGCVTTIRETGTIGTIDTTGALTPIIYGKWSAAHAWNVSRFNAASIFHLPN